MSTTLKPLLELTAEDLMTRDLLVFSEQMPLREAAQTLLRAQVGGAPVVDANGKCVGVLAALDFVRLFEAHPNPQRLARPAQPITCPFQAKLGQAAGRDVVLCLLPPGTCPLQRRPKNGSGNSHMLCQDPHCVLTDWQVVEVDRLPEVPVHRYMTADPVTVTSDESIQELARKMVDAHIHRVVVVDEQSRPIGMVTGTDVLAAIGYAAH